ncbi:MAG: energy transducer TonB [Candidatus Omnitrophica bacterium]|nr:energy transducer TonB [Candidatus Omnitrophota bacterium]
MLLLKDRYLNIAILVSASCHLVFMLMVTPVFISQDFKKNNTAIAFLGAILEKIVVVPDRASFIHKLKRVNYEEVDPVRTSLAAPEISGKVSGGEADKDDFAPSMDKGVAASTHSREKNRPLFSVKKNILEGEAKNRLVLYRPDLARQPVFRSDFNSDYTVGVKFIITKDGLVQNPECVLSSGSFVVDQAAIRYIRRWQFCPYYDERGAGQEALIHLNFNPL